MTTTPIPGLECRLKFFKKLEVKLLTNGFKYFPIRGRRKGGGEKLLVREGIEEQKNRYLKVVGEADDKREKDNGERR